MVYTPNESFLSLYRVEKFVNFCYCQSIALRRKQNRSGIFFTSKMTKIFTMSYPPDENHLRNSKRKFRQNDRGLL